VKRAATEEETLAEEHLPPPLPPGVSLP